MKKYVKVVFDRKNVASKTGTGKIEICCYLSREERKWETVGTSTPDSWEVAAQSRNILAKVKHYEEVIKAMQMLNEEMTVENFNNHVMVEASKQKAGDSNIYNGNDLRQSFVEFCRESLAKEDLAKNSIKNFNVVFDAVAKHVKNGITVAVER